MKRCKLNNVSDIVSIVFGASDQVACRDMHAKADGTAVNDLTAYARSMFPELHAIMRLETVSVIAGEMWDLVDDAKAATLLLEKSQNRQSPAWLNDDSVLIDKVASASGCAQGKCKQYVTLNSTSASPTDTIRKGAKDHVIITDNTGATVIYKSILEQTLPYWTVGSFLYSVILMVCILLLLAYVAVVK